MRVLVTGGSGFVGREIVGQLTAAGHIPRVLARGDKAPRAGVEFARGSVLEPASLLTPAKDCDAVIHLVGIISEAGEQTFERVHLEGTRNVLATAGAASISRFIHMSALGARPDAPARYHRSKWAAEEAVRASGLAWTIFRPSLIYGPGDGFVNLFARMSRWSPVLPVIGSGHSLVQPVAVEDVARCFVGALAQPRSVGQSYDLCGRERLSFRAVLEEILRATGRRRLRLGLPLPVARLQARVLETLCPRLLGQAPPLNRDQILMLQEDNVGDPGPACRMFGLEPTPFREGIRRFLG